VIRKDRYDSRTVTAQKDLHLLKLVNVNDFVISLRSFQGGIEFARDRGIISPAYTILYPRKAGVHGYLSYLFKSKPFIDGTTLFLTGIREGQNIEYPRLARSRLALPSPEEQSAIVRFLDHADARIRRYIAAKQKLIKLLQEEKQAIIHRAVTRGLDADVRLKTSGVEWLGYVPEHWEVVPLRRRWTVTDCKHLTVPFIEDGVPLVSVREVQSFDVCLDQAKRTTEEWFRVLVEGDRQPRRGDLVYCRNVSIGTAAVVETDETLAMGQDVCLIRSKDQNQRYLNYFLKSPAMDQQLALLKVGSTFDRINVAEVKNLLIVVPPRQEQNLIAHTLDEMLAATERAIALINTKQTLLREYRARLIADVVTGRLDVHEAAARLTDEVPEAGPLDEMDDLPQDQDPAEVEELVTEDAA
jgi:type I restriction enzyme S subunit